MSLEASNALDESVVTLPVMEIISGTRRGPIILLTSSTIKPIDAFSDKFWQEFLDQSITVLTRVYCERCRDCILALPFLLHFWIGPMTSVDSLHSVAVTVYLTGAFFVHSGLAKEFFHIAATLLYPVQAIFFGLLFLCFQCYIDSVLLFVLGVISCYCFPFSRSVQETAVHSYLQTVGIYCKSQLNGCRIKYLQEKQRTGIKWSFVFPGRRANVVATSGLAELGQRGYLPLAPGASTAEDGKMQFRLFVHDSSGSVWSKAFVKQQLAGDDYILSTRPIGNSPPGIPPETWMEVVNDLSDEIQTSDTFVRKTLVVVVLYIAISITCFVLSGAVNYLLPLQMTIPFIALAISRRMMERKLDVINKLEGLTFASSMRYHVSYHTVHRYSSCDDYILFHREGSNQGDSGDHD